MKIYLPVLIMAALALGGCKDKPPANQHTPTPPRTDYTPEEFGVGRTHTKSRTCNREIDQLLEELRVCYGSRPQAECEALQHGHSEKIGRMKNSNRCRH